MLTSQQKQDAINMYQKERLDKFNPTNEGFSNAVASIAAEPGYQISDSVLYDKALANPNAIGMTKDQIEIDRGAAVARVARLAYKQKAAEVFENVLLQTEDPSVAQHTADLVLKYYNDETAKIADPIQQRDRARKVISDLQTYNEDGLSFGNFTGLAEYMQSEAANRVDIALPYKGDMRRVAVSKTFVNQDADLGFTTRLALSAISATLPGNLAEMMGAGDSAQRQYEAFKEQGLSSWGETAAAVGATLLQARYLGKAVKAWGINNVGISNAISYLASSVGTGALQDINESAHGLKNQYFNPIARTGDKTFTNQYVNSRLFDLGTAWLGAYTGSRIEAGLFGRGLAELNGPAKTIGSIMLAQVLSPVLDTAADVALDVTAHNLISSQWGEGEPFFTNSQEMQLSMKGKDAGEIMRSLGTLYSIRMAAKAGSGVINKALADRSIDVTKSKDVMGTDEWFDKEIADRNEPEWQKAGFKAGMKFTNWLFGNNLAELDEAFRSEYKDKAPNLTAFLRGNAVTNRNNLVALYMQREAYKNWLVSAIAGSMDGRVRQELSTADVRARAGNDMFETLNDLRKRTVVNVSRAEDAMALGLTVGQRIGGNANTPDTINAELDKLLETHRFSDNTFKVLQTYLSKNLSNAINAKAVNDYFGHAEARQNDRLALNERVKAEYVKDLHLDADYRLTADERLHTVLGVGLVGGTRTSTRYQEFMADRQEALEIVDDRMRLINAAGEGLLDILIRDSAPGGTGTPASLVELRRAAGAFVVGRGGITADNIHDELKTSLREFARQRLLELKHEMKGVCEGKAGDEAAIKILERFKQEVGFIAQAYPESEVSAFIKDINHMYETAPAAIKTLYDNHVKSNADLASYINKTGASTEGDMFTRLLGTMAALADEVKLDRFLFNSAISKGTAMTPQKVYELLRRDYTIDHVRSNVAANRGFDIQQSKDGAGMPVVRFNDQYGNPVPAEITGLSGKRNIENGLVFLTTARKGEFKSDPELVKTVMILIRAAKFKSDALRASRTAGSYDVYGDALDNILLRLSTGPDALIRYDATTGDFTVLNPNRMAAIIEDEQSHILTVLRAISEDFENTAEPDFRYDEKISVFDGYLDGDLSHKAHQTEIRMETLANDVRIRAGKNKVDIETVVYGIANSERNKATARTLLAGYLRDHGLAEGMPPASQDRLASYMLNYARDMRGRSTTYDVGDDQVIYSSEFSAGIESVDRQYGHQFITIATEKLSPEAQEELSNTSKVFKEYHLVKLQESMVNRSAVYMKIPDFDDNVSSKFFGRNTADMFFKSVLTSIKNRITDRDTSLTTTGYASRMERIVTDAITNLTAHPIGNKHELMTRISKLYEDIANNGKAVCNDLLTRMGVPTTGTNTTPGHRTKHTTSANTTRADAAASAIIKADLVPLKLQAFNIGNIIARTMTTGNPLTEAQVITATNALADAMRSSSATGIAAARAAFITAITPAGSTITPAQLTDINSRIDTMLSSSGSLPLTYGAGILRNQVQLNMLLHRLPATATTAGTTYATHLTNTLAATGKAFTGSIANLIADARASMNADAALRQNLKDFDELEYDERDLDVSILPDQLILGSDVSNAEVVHRGESVVDPATGESIAVGTANKNSSQIRQDEIKELQKIKEGFEAVLRPEKDRTPLFTKDSIQNDEFRAYAALGNLLMYGTKYVWAQMDIDKRGAGTREVKHRGFGNMATQLRKGLSKGTNNVNVVVMRIALNKVNDIGVAPGLHLLTKSLYERVNLNGGSKPILTGDAALTKSQFAMVDGYDQMMADLVKAYNEESANANGGAGRTIDSATLIHSNGKSTGKVQTNYTGVADIIKLDKETGKFFYDLDGSGKMNANGESNPEVHIMALDEDSFKQYSPNLIEKCNFGSSGTGNDEVSYYNMDRTFHQVAPTSSGTSVAIDAANDFHLDTSVCAIRDKNIIADMFDSFMTHRDTMSTYGKDNTVSFQGANDDPNTRRYLTETVRLHAKSTMAELMSVMGSLKAYTPEQIKDGMQKISNTVSDAITSPGVTTVIKNQRTNKLIIPVDGMAFKMPLRGGIKPTGASGRIHYKVDPAFSGRSSMNTSSSTHPIQTHLGDATVRELAIQHLKDLKNLDTVSIVDETGKKVNATKQSIVEAIKRSQGTRTNSNGYTIPDTQERAAGLKTLLAFIDAQEDGCIKSIEFAPGQRGYFIMLNRSPNIQRGQGQSLPALIAGIEPDSDQISLHSSLARINLADFDGDTMSTQSFSVKGLKESLKIAHLADNQIAPYLLDFAMEAIASNKFTTQLTPITSSIDTDLYPRAERASGIVIGAFDKVNKVLTRIAAMDNRLSRGNKTHTAGYDTMGLDTAVLYKETDGDLFNAEHIRGAAESILPLDTIRVGSKDTGKTYNAMRVTNVDAVGNKTYQLYLCENEPELAGVGYKVAYVVDLDAADVVDMNSIFMKVDSVSKHLNGSSAGTLDPSIHDVSAEKLRFCSFALLHKVLQSTSIDAPKYQTLYAMFNNKGEKFPNWIESLAEIMAASLATRTIWSGGKFIPVTYSVTNKALADISNTASNEYSILEKEISIVISNIGFDAKVELADAITKVRSNSEISNNDYDKLIRFASKKNVTDISSMTDVLELFENNPKLKTLAEQFIGGATLQKFAGMHPDFLKGLSMGYAFKTMIKKFMTIENLKELGIVPDDFVEGELPTRFTGPDGKSDGQPMKITYAIELRQILNEVNEAFSDVVMVNHTKSTMAHLKKVLGSEIAIAMPGTKGSSEESFRVRLMQRIANRFPGIPFSDRELDGLLAEMDISVHEGRVINEDTTRHLKRLQAETFNGRTGVVDMSKRHQAEMHRNHTDAETFTDGVFLKFKNGKNVTVNQLITLINDKIIQYESRANAKNPSINAGAKMKVEAFKALALEIGGQLLPSQQYAFKAVANGLSEDLVGEILAGNGLITGHAAETFRNKRMGGATKHLFKEVFNTNAEVGIC